VLADRPLIELGSQTAAAFTEALDAPATVNQRLATALARPRKFRWIDWAPTPRNRGRRVRRLLRHRGRRAVVVSALDESASSWWERLGFHPFDPTDHNSLDLYLHG
jgi:Protein of unknown function (DUF1778)